MAHASGPASTVTIWAAKMIAPTKRSRTNCCRRLSLGGLPVILYYLSGKHPTRVTRASIVVFLVITALVSLLTYISHGIITKEIIVRSVWLAPFFILAIWVGGGLFGKVSEFYFRTVTLALLGSVGIGMLFS